MASSVYVETSVISYLVARASRDLVVAARQALTQEWWQEARVRYEMCVSVLVLEEAGQGDSEWARRRLESVGDLPVLDLTTPEELGGLET